MVLVSYLCFHEQETLPSSLSTSWFQEQIQREIYISQSSSFPNQTKLDQFRYVHCKRQTS